MPRTAMQLQQQQRQLPLRDLLGPCEYAEVCIRKIYSDSGFVSCTQCAIATVQVRYCVMLYAHSNTTRYTKHAGFGFNCAARSNTRDGAAPDRLAGKGVNGTRLPIGAKSGTELEKACEKEDDREAAYDVFDYSTLIKDVMRGTCRAERSFRGADYQPRSHEG